MVVKVNSNGDAEDVRQPQQIFKRDKKQIIRTAKNNGEEVEPTKNIESEEINLTIKNRGYGRLR